MVIIMNKLENVSIDEIFADMVEVEIEMVELVDGTVVPKSNVNNFEFDGFVGEPY